MEFFQKERTVISLVLIQLLSGTSLLNATGTFFNPIKNTPGGVPGIIQNATNALSSIGVLSGH